MPLLRATWSYGPCRPPLFSNNVAGLERKGEGFREVNHQNLRPISNDPPPLSARRAESEGSASPDPRGRTSPGAPTPVIISDRHARQHLPRQQTKHRRTKSNVLPDTFTSRCPCTILCSPQRAFSRCPSQPQAAPRAHSWAG